MSTILVIRNDGDFSSKLSSAGLKVIDLELIETKPLDDQSALRKKLANLSEYDGLFFTSPVAAEIFLRERNGSDGFGGSVYALGRRAQQMLDSAGLNVVLARDANTAEEMLNELGSAKFTGKRFLFIRGERSLRTIPDMLADTAVVNEVAVYKTEPTMVDRETIDKLRSNLSNGEIEWVCFFSPSGVERFAKLFGDEAANVKAAAIGKTTAAALAEAGYDVQFISPRSSAEDFARSLIEHIRTIE
jgi:uroporphyrinogen-III synthase